MLPKCKEEWENVYGKLKIKLHEKSIENDRLKKVLQKKATQISDLANQVDVLTKNVLKLNSIYKAIDILQMDKIKKDQQINELILLQKHHKVTIKRLNEEVSQLRRKYPRRTGMVQLSSSNSNTNFVQTQLLDKDRELQRSNTSIHTLLVKNTCLEKQLVQQKKKLKASKEKKDITSSNMSKHLRQSNLCGHLKKSEGQFYYSLSPQN